MKQLRDAARTNNDDDRRQVIAELVKIGPPAVELLSAALKDSEPAIRASAAEVLGKIGNHPARERLTIALKEDSNSSVRVAAINALRENPDSNIVPAIIGILADSDSNIKKAALVALIAG